MTLARLFQPESIAVVGASGDADSISGRPLRILQQHGYRGRLYPVNPRHSELLGLPAYPSVAAIPGPVDVALVAVNAARVPDVLRECAEAGVHYAVVISSGFAEQADGGGNLEQAVAAVAASTPIRICGPNCEGLINLHGPVPLGFSPTIDYERGLRRLVPGDVAIVAQSGALAFALMDDAQARGLGCSCVISSGNEVDLDVLDYVEALLEEPHTRAILLFVEGFRNARRFAPIASRALAAGKPIAVAKVGRSPAARRAAVSHTAHLTGDDAAYDAVFRRYGAVRVDDQQELVDLGLAFSRCPLPRGRRVGILTVSGGAGTWLADVLAEQALEVPALADEVQRRIREFLPPYGSAANPVDVTAQVLRTPGALAGVLELMLESDELDAIALITTLAAPRLLERERERLGELVATGGKPIVVYSYTQASEASVELLRELGLAWYPSPLRAARALRALVDYADARRATAASQQRRPVARGPRISAPAGATLLEHECKELLRGWGLPTPAGRFVATLDELAEAAAALRPPLCLKAQSRTIVHKSEAGAVALGLEDQAAVVRSAEAMAGRLGDAVEGFLVEETAPPGVEMIAGVVNDPDVGLLVLVGTGGIHAELLHDVMLRPGPIGRDDAAAMIDGLRGAALLRGARGAPPADQAALEDCLVTLWDFASAHEEAIREVDLNPVIVAPRGQGVCVVDATIVLR